ncbi:MAG: hypothetical protein HQL06_12585 [Nitrospirae bacterium]|nr:hypothetical protein [Nitrospirota bacterium]
MNITTSAGLPYFYIRRDWFNRFKDNGNGTITDIQTGLMWTKDANLTEEKN